MALRLGVRMGTLPKTVAGRLTIFLPPSATRALFDHLVRFLGPGRFDPMSPARCARPAHGGPSRTPPCCS